MEIQGLTGAQIRPTPRVMAESVAPNMAQSLLPQDSLSLQTRGTPRNGPAPNTRLSDMKPEELKALGGGASVESIARAQPDTTVGELGPLLRNPEALDSIAGLMQHRSDLKIGDFVSRDKEGKVRIDPSYKDPQTMELLKERDNITPSEISAMRSNFAKTLKDPDMARMATQKSFELLKKRPDLSPEELGKMMHTFHGAAGGEGKDKSGGGGPEGGAMAALSMFDSATKAMSERNDLDPKRMGEMARSVGELSSPEDKNGPSLVAEGFESATKSLQENPLRQPEDMSKLAETMGQHMGGDDEDSAGHRMNAFKQTSEMLGNNASMDHQDVGRMLTQAAERDPKIRPGEGGQSAKRMASVVNDVTTGVKQGAVPPTDLSAHFRNQDAERARFQPQEQRSEGEQRPQEHQGREQGAQPSGVAEGGEGKPPRQGGETSSSGSDGTSAAPSERLDPFARQASVPSSRPGEAPTLDLETARNAGPGDAAGTRGTEERSPTSSGLGAGDKQPPDLGSPTVQADPQRRS